MAVLQLMSALAYLQVGLYVYQSSTDLSASGVALSICAALTLLNLVAGWTLLDETRFGIRLSFVNILAQTVSMNLPVFAYIYTGVARFYVSISVHGEPKPDLLVGTGFDLLQTSFNIGLSELPNLPTIAVSPVAMAFVFYLSKRLRAA